MQKDFLLEDLKERDHLKDVSIYGFQRNWMRGCKVDSHGSRWGPVVPSCEHGNGDNVVVV